MDGFYAYIIGSDGHIINRVDLAFEKQEDAEKHAKCSLMGTTSSCGNWTTR